MCNWIPQFAENTPQTMGKLTIAVYSLTSRGSLVLYFCFQQFIPIGPGYNDWITGLWCCWRLDRQDYSTGTGTGETAYTLSLLCGRMWSLIVDYLAVGWRLVLVDCVRQCGLIWWLLPYRLIGVLGFTTVLETFPNWGNNDTTGLNMASKTVQKYHFDPKFLHLRAPSDSFKPGALHPHLLYQIKGQFRQR